MCLFQRQITKAILIASSIAFVVSVGAFGDEPLEASKAAQAVDESKLKDALDPYYVRVAAEYQFCLDQDRREVLELQKHPVLKWTNAEGYMGSVFIWNHKGRPELIGCIGSHQPRPGVSTIFHEFHSLSTTALQPVTVGSVEWRPQRAGVALMSVDGAPSPSDSERLRLTQMRSIAREFVGAMKDGNDVTELRLLPQPICRFKAETQNIRDGAIFAFVWKGTDPEVLLMLEDHQSGDTSQWKYALARFNHRELWIKRRDKEVWRVNVATKADNYFVHTVGDKSIAEIQTFVPREDR